MNVLVQSALISALSVFIYSMVKPPPVQEKDNTHTFHMYVGGIIFVVSVILLLATQKSQDLVSAIPSTSTTSFKPPF